MQEHTTLQIEKMKLMGNTVARFGNGTKKQMMVTILFEEDKSGKNKLIDRYAYPDAGIDWGTYFISLLASWPNP